MIKALVIEEKALAALDAALVQQEWFQSFQLPQNDEGVRRVELGDMVYIFTTEADEASRYLVLNTSIFSDDAKPEEVFQRAIRVASRAFDRNVAIPVSWKPFHEHSLLSIYAHAERHQESVRLYFDQSPSGSDNVYAFARTPTTMKFHEVAAETEIYTKAIGKLLDAILVPPPTKIDVGAFGILLKPLDGASYGSPGLLDDWLKHKLNEDQLAFVRKPHSTPVRLRGAAGTGKTQAMAVKCLHDLYSDHDDGGEKVFAFLTHSSALAHDVMRRMFHMLDPTDRWKTLRTADGRSKLWVGTLYEFAEVLLENQKKGLEPLSNDGIEGRLLQRMLVSDAVEEVRKSPRIALGVGKRAQSLADVFAASEVSEARIDDIQNEISSVLEAEGIRKGGALAEKYRSAKRESWRLDLRTEADRDVVLEVYDAYREALKRQKLLSLDQIVADLGQYLSTNIWDQLRDRDGFDLIFVDEYHYFSQIETTLLHNLFRPRACVDGKWPLIMAYDLKQNTSDVGLSGGIQRFKNPGVGESVKVDLDTVYRYSAQISAFLKDLDAGFPALDLEGEFQPYNPKGNGVNGPLPRLRNFVTNIDLIDSVVAEATEMLRVAEFGGRDVAILCLDEALFNTYRNASRIRSKVVSVVSREDMRELQYAKRNCIFSMPEFVAGLQFETVFLINADLADFEAASRNASSLRRYISRAYLGASRTRKNLIIATSDERGGASPLLSPALSGGSLVNT